MSMSVVGWLKKSAIKIVELSLALHGFLHIIEFGSAIYEEAYLTASLAAFGAITMILGAVFLGHHHPHTHKIEHHHE